MTTVLTQRDAPASLPSSALDPPTTYEGGLHVIEQFVRDGVVDRETGERLCARIRALMVGPA